MLLFGKGCVVIFDFQSDLNYVLLQLFKGVVLILCEGFDGEIFVFFLLCFVCCLWKCVLGFYRFFILNERVDVVFMDLVYEVMWWVEVVGDGLNEVLFELVI